ncbi:MULTISPECIES: BA14K family protein [unclassified Rhizobium]|uniref:BA14K family protein n=1 Tax=unclassified Rhizobium TaxID=2613769 RepID=UPI0037F7A7FB
MVAFQRVALGCAFGLSLLTQAGLATAASDPPKIGIPLPSPGNRVLCDARGCFGFGERQFYTRPGQPLPITPPYTGGVNRYDSTRIQMPPRETYAPPKVVYPTPAQQRTQHQMWCARQYRTYNPGTNLYTTINHGSKECHSPFD